MYFQKQNKDSRFFFFLCYLGFLILFISYRFLFAFFFFDKQDWHWLPFFRALIYGLRFDGSILATALVLPYLLSLFCRRSGCKLVWFSWPLVFFVFFWFHLLAGLLYFRHARKPLGYEAILFFRGESLPVVQSAFWANPWLFILVLLFSLLLLSLLALKARQWFFLIDAGHFARRDLFILLFGLVSLRGGWQKSFLRPSHAILSAGPIYSQMAMNPIFLFAYSLQREGIPPIHQLAMDKSLTIVRKQITYPGSHFISETYPLLRKLSTPSGQKKSLPNHIFLFFLESWNSRSINVRNTPHFLQWKQQGVYFSNFFATGGRTTNGLLAVLTGVPDSPGLSSVHTEQGFTRFSTLPRILRHLGYSSFFITGSDLDFENLNIHIKKWGYNHILDSSNLSLAGQKKNTWGFADGPVLQRMQQQVSLLEKKNQKGFFTFLSVSTHFPFTIPDSYSQKCTNDLCKYHRALFYSDRMIGKFLRFLEQKQILANSLLIFVADHTQHMGLNYFEDRKIPFLLLYPNRLEPTIVTKFGGQLDIIPTVLGILGRPVTFTAFGKDLLQPESASFAYYVFGNLYGWIQPDSYYIQNLHEDNIGFNLQARPPFSNTNRCPQTPILCQQLKEKSRAFLNLTDSLKKNGRIFP